MTGYFVGTTDKDPLTYTINEPITFKIELFDNDGIFTDPVFRYYKYHLQTDDGRSEDGYADGFDHQPLFICTRLKRAGFVRLIVEACDINKIPISGIDKFDGGAGADVRSIECDTYLPEDFMEFWAEVVRDVMQVEPVVLEKIFVDKPEFPDHDIYKVKIAAPYGKPCQGFLTYPKKHRGEKLNVVVHYLGYGVEKTHIFPKDDQIVFITNAHGIEPDEDDEYYANLRREPDGELYRYGFDNIENSLPHTSYFKKVIARDMQAARFVRTLPEWNGVSVIAEGGSQGAFRATSVAAHDKNITNLSISIPWLCNLGGYKKGRMRGWSPDYVLGLCYFDTANQARYVSCPTEITVAGLGDYVCPPSGVMAMYNNLNCEKKIRFVQNRTHGYEPPVAYKYCISG